MSNGVSENMQLAEQVTALGTALSEQDVALPDVYPGTGEQRVNDAEDAPGTDQREAQSTALYDADGNIIGYAVTWVDTNQTYGGPVYYKVLDANRQPVTDDILVDDTFSDLVQGKFPRIVALEDGKFAIKYTELTHSHDSESVELQDYARVFHFSQADDTVSPVGDRAETVEPYGKNFETSTDAPYADFYKLANGNLAYPYKNDKNLYVAVFTFNEESGQLERVQDTNGTVLPDIAIPARINLVYDRTREATAYSTSFTIVPDDKGGFTVIQGYDASYSEADEGANTIYALNVNHNDSGAYEISQNEEGKPHYQLIQRTAVEWWRREDVTMPEHRLDYSVYEDYYELTGTRLDNGNIAIAYSTNYPHSSDNTTPETAAGKHVFTRVIGMDENGDITTVSSRKEPMPFHHPKFEGYLTERAGYPKPTYEQQQGQPTLMGLENGEYVLGWTAKHGNDDDILLAKFDAGGSPLNIPKSISSVQDNATDQLDVDLVEAGDGKLVATFTAADSKSGSYDSDVFIRELEAIKSDLYNNYLPVIINADGKNPDGHATVGTVTKSTSSLAI